MTERSVVLCECDSIDCDLFVELPLDETAAVLGRVDVFVIVDGCRQGPKPGDVLVEQRDGFGLYREAKESQ